MLCQYISSQISELQESQERDQKRHAEQLSKLQQQIEKNKEVISVVDL